MICTLAMIAALAGKPAVMRGDTVDIPRWRYEQATPSDRNRAIACLRQQGVGWRIVEDRK